MQHETNTDHARRAATSEHTLLHRRQRNAADGIDSIVLLRKILEQRRNLITSGRSQLGERLDRECTRTICRVEAWLDCWKPTEAQVRKHIKRHYIDILTLVPGGNSTAGAKWRRQLEEVFDSSQ